MASLTYDEARARAELIGVTSYQIELDLTGMRDGGTLRSRVSVSFSARADGETFVDVVADSVQAWLDGRPLDAAGYDGERLRLAVRAGEHDLVVESTTSRTGQRAGIHRAVDPGDGEAYVWTSFEPDDARRVFACFDQPDLKATVQVTVTAPAGWTVASNTLPVEVTPGDPVTTWQFAKTPRLPTYLVVVTAGPFTRCGGPSTGTTSACWPGAAWPATSTSRPTSCST